MSIYLALGRVGSGLSGELGDVAKWSVAANDKATVEVEYACVSLANAQTVRDQLLALNESRPVIPVTWTEDSTVDGYYQIESVAVEHGPEFFQAFMVTATVAMTPLLPRRGVVVQGFTSGGSRTVYSNTAVYNRIYTPTSWNDFRLIRAVGTSTGLASTITAGGITMQGYDNTATSGLGFYALWEAYVPPAKFYDAAVTLTNGGSPYLGRGASLDPLGGWTLDNGYVKVALASSSMRALGSQIQMQYAVPAGNAWGSTVYEAGMTRNTSTTPLFPITASPGRMTVVRNTPECVSVMLTYSTGTVGYNVTMRVTLVRGMRHAVVTWGWTNFVGTAPFASEGAGYRIGFVAAGTSALPNGWDAGALGFKGGGTDADGWTGVIGCGDATRTFNGAGTTGIAVSTPSVDGITVELGVADGSTLLGVNGTTSFVYMVGNGSDTFQKVCVQ